MSQIERIAILGANSQIALDYIESSLENSRRELSLFSRNPIALQNLVDSKYTSRFKSCGYDQFGVDSYDLIINFVGGSDPVLIANMGKDIFTLTDYYDDLAIGYLQKNDQCKYIFISSGAAYGDVFSNGPALENTKSKFDLNNLAPVQYYGAAKYLVEQRHRNLPDLKIVDIRIFSYFSKRQNLDTKLFLPQVITAIKNKTEFLTLDEEMWRDYIGADDFYRLINSIACKKIFNMSIDSYSKAPINKFELLNEFRRIFDLKFKLQKLDADINLTGPSTKFFYYSLNRSFLKEIIYSPQLDSLQLLTSVVKKLI